MTKIMPRRIRITHGRAAAGEPERALRLPRAGLNLAIRAMVSSTIRLACENQSNAAATMARSDSGARRVPVHTPAR